MSIVGASGVHRRQLAFEYPDTVTVEQLKRPGDPSRPGAAAGPNASANSPLETGVAGLNRRLFVPKQAPHPSDLPAAHA